MSEVHEVARPVDRMRSLGALLKAWRTRRRYSQLELALTASISQRHLSFVESGRSTPSRDMLLHLAEHLDIPLRDRNTLLLAAGYAPLFLVRPLDDPSLAPARRAIDLLLERHSPFPAIAIDARWNMLSANDAARGLLGVLADPELLATQVNVIRLSFHPRGLAPHIINLDQWKGHLIDRIRRQVESTADRELTQLLADLREVGQVRPAHSATEHPDEVFVPLVLETPIGRLSLLSTTTTFGTPAEITLSEIAIEAFFPADDDTHDALTKLASRA